MTKRPRVFIGSSKESHDVADAIQELLQYDADTVIWSQGIFAPGFNSAESLLKRLNEFEFAIFIFAPDDLITIRNSKMQAVRDNLIFELGLFMSRLGRDRTIFIVPREDEVLHLPTDLMGITPIKANFSHNDGILVGLGPACASIKRILRELNSVKPLRTTEDFERLLRRYELRKKVRSAFHSCFLADCDTIMCCDLDNFHVNGRTCDEEKIQQIKQHVGVIIAEEIESCATLGAFVTSEKDEYYCIIKKDRADIDIVAERIRQGVQTKNWQIPIVTTISIGLAYRIKDESLDDWIDRAELATMTSKERGKNTVTVATKRHFYMAASFDS